MRSVRTFTSRMAPRRRKSRHKFSYLRLFTSIFVFFGTFYLAFTYLKFPGEVHLKPVNYIQRLVEPEQCTYYAGQEQKANITTTELYDSLLFDNQEGGVWRQGWELKYDGDEWDKQKLRVYVVPHSHNDPGWIRTVEEYYSERTTHILNTIITTLSKDKKRKFIWEEMSYLQRWWQDASEENKIKMKNLIKSGQLEIVGGGWVMNDEANSHYFAIIDQIIEGNNWLFKAIGVTPLNAWSIDPFGHSPTMAYLYKQMGFQNLLIQRTHYEIKRALAKKQSLEFMWRQNWDPSDSTDFLTHMMPFYSYDIPHTCGPDPSICCQFDFARLFSAGTGYTCPWHKSPQEINSNNVKERAFSLLDQYRKKSLLFKTNVLLIPLGDDFRYIYEKEANSQFDNYERLFDYMNKQKQWNVQVSWGTLNDYFLAMREETNRLGLVLPSLSGDFFTYADVNQDYWSGYYTSRPYFKAMDRSLEAYLRSAEIMFAFAYSLNPSKETSTFPHRFANDLVYARRQLALFQHHDGVTGTAKDHVMIDYANRMFMSLTRLQNFMSEATAALLNQVFRSGEKEISLDWNFFTPEIHRSAFDALPQSQKIQIQFQIIRRVVFFNSIEETVQQVVSVVVDSPQVVVLDSNGQCIQSQIMPKWELHTTSTPSITYSHRLFWKVKLPPMGFQTYFVSHSSNFPECSVAEKSVVEVYGPAGDFRCPSFYQCDKISTSSISSVSIKNNNFVLHFDTKNGMLREVKDLRSGQTTRMEEEFAYYRTHSSGAYLFKPDGGSSNGVENGGLVLTSKGSLVQECHLQPNFQAFKGHSPISRTSRLYSGYSPQSMAIEMHHRVEMNKMQMNNVEIVVRYKTDLQNQQLWFSDINGYQTMRRETLDKIPLQGNFYPMPSSAFLHDRFGKRFSVHSKQAVGVASLQEGWLEMMLDRRLVQDDNRGVGQGVTDNHPMNTVFHLLLETNTSFLSHPLPPSSSFFPSVLSHQVNSRLNYPSLAFYGKEEKSSALKRLKLSNRKMGSNEKVGRFLSSFSPLSVDFPCDFHVVNFKVQDVENLEQENDKKNPIALILQRRGYDCTFNSDLALESTCRLSTDGKIDLKKTFGNFEVDNFYESLLSLTRPKNTMSDGNSMHNVDGSYVKMNPMEIEAFQFRLTRQIEFE